MSSAAGAPDPGPDSAVIGTIVLFDQDGLIMVSLPYRGSDPPGALASLLSRWQGYGSRIAAGTVIDRDGQALAHAQI
jgi:hypothetical protein